MTARFSEGARVRISARYPAEHHRVPDYVKGLEGEIERVCDAYGQPESLAYGGDGLLRSLVVDESLRGTGLGRRLTAAARAAAAASGIGRIYLLTETAAPFFEQEGFIAVARSAVPQEVRASREFAEQCPDTAVAMTARP